MFSKIDTPFFTTSYNIQMQERALPIALLKRHFDIAKFLLEQEIVQGEGERKVSVFVIHRRNNVKTFDVREL